MVGRKGCALLVSEADFRAAATLHSGCFGVFHHRWPPSPVLGRGVATVATLAGSRRAFLAHEVERSDEESSDYLVTGLTGLSLALPAPLGSAPAGTDLLPEPE